ncbi:hypothetical protein BaRGS_00018563 [Batillaria attramentaria]|uniref:Uncharacterized protein n=1 Tax=Batillaria attramentaria TaxID=370345 RepID=A0ABD0KTF8_9CAEN
MCYVALLALIGHGPQLTARRLQRAGLSEFRQVSGISPRHATLQPGWSEGHGGKHALSTGTAWLIFAREKFSPVELGYRGKGWASQLIAKGGPRLADLAIDHGRQS